MFVRMKFHPITCLYLIQALSDRKMKVTTVLLLLLGIGYTFADTCSVDPDDRTDCGWYGIDEETCEGRGCCWDENHALWCFYATDDKCYGIKPEEREECGYFGIQRYECEVVKDCCWVESMVPYVPWCFKGKLPKKAPPTAPPPPPTAPSNETTVEPTEVFSNGTIAAPTTASSNQTAALAEDEQAFEEAHTA